MKSSFQEILVPPHSFSFISTQNTPDTFPPHWHTMAEFIVASNDTCKFSVNHEIYTLEPGEVLLIWPTELHFTISNPHKASILLQFNDDLVTNCKDFDVIYHTLRKVHALKDFSPSLNSEIAAYLLQIYELYESRSEPFPEPKILIKIYEMMITLCNYLQTENTRPSQTSDTIDTNFYVIKKACNYINEYYDRPLTELEVAEYCGFSTFYFSKIFHSYTQESFPEYLAKKRLSAATKLLNSEAISIADVAYQSGFQSISNFNKVFKKTMGCTPLQYRKLYSDE